MSNASLVASTLSNLTLAQVAAVYNEGVEFTSAEGFSVVKKFASKDAGIARVEKLLAFVDGYADLQLGPGEDEGSSKFTWVHVEQTASEVTEEPAAEEPAAPEGWTEAGGPTDQEPAAEEPAAEAPFVKLSKAELDALGERGSPAREAYRKARRAAARQARKAKAE